MEKKQNVNLSSLGFLRALRHKNRQFAVIGLGRFGRAVCESLHKLGYEVLGTDIEEKRVAAVLTNQIASHAVQLDSTEPFALKEAGIFEFDTVIIAIGNYLQESIITTLSVKEAGVPYVVAKASTEIHGKLLKRVGADHVVFPEFEAGCALARSLTRPSILEHFDLDPEHSIVEIIVPEEFHHKTIAELQLRSRFGISVLAVGSENKFEINPNPNLRLWKGAVMVVIGNNKNIDQLV
ncbi:TrkA family potassium uptake protein [Synechococcales cyanobacterium C]|uniref:TrkA family potassium uptake protein n=1 Tax=Petrachloros mirabilis ULC683 TaxID=2781853 RepID=A0A8K2A8V5_9CYAN|nr:TrkA family potassium uptake protein [Petrachloros mirabilis]NCJ08449.1 TrkA family potassium uptake protein [Petrachloros mirabilis ULC683]